MATKNALKILKKRADEDLELHEAYIEEKKKYQIGYKIRECRKRAGLTQKALAKRIRTKQSVISRLENAEYKGHSFGILKKISKALNTSVDVFLNPETHGILKLQNFRVMKKAQSFSNWNKNQIIVKRPHAR